MGIRKLAMVISATALLSACAAADAAINHSKLDVQTHMSESVFLDPVPPAAKSIYVSARNTSDHPEIDLRASLAQAMMSRGYQVVQDPDAAHYMLRVNVLQAGEIEQKDKGGLLSARYGDPLLGAAVGAAAGAAIGGGNPYAASGTALVGGLTAFAADQLLKTVTYSVVVDIQLSERPLKGGKVYQSTTTAAMQGNVSAEHIATGHRAGASPQAYSYNATGTNNSRAKVQNIEEEADFKQYQIRQVAYADQLNLKFEEAAPMLVAKLTSSLSNLFE